MSAAEIELRNPILAAILAWMVPGLGHVYQGRIGKAFLFFFCVMGLFLLGTHLGSNRVVYYRWDRKEWSWPYLAQAGVGIAAVPAFFRTMDPAKWDVELDDLHRAGKIVDIARIFTMIAGLLNLLVIYDAFAGPALYDEEEKLLAELDKKPLSEDAPA